MLKNIRLIKFKSSDLERLIYLFSNETILRDLNLKKNASDRTVRSKWLSRKIKAYSQEKPQEFNLGIEISGELIGSVGLHKINYRTKTAVVGYWIGESYWGRGYTSRALKDFLKIVSQKWGLKKIEAVTLADNIPSQRVLEKVGFKYIKIMRKSVKYGKQYKDEKLYQLQI